MPYVLAVIDIDGFTPEDLLWKINELADGSAGRGDELSVKHAMAVVKREKLRFFVVPPAAGEGEKGFSPVMTLGRSSQNLFSLRGKTREVGATTISGKHLSLRVGGDGVSFLGLCNELDPGANRPAVNTKHKPTPSFFVFPFLI